MFPRPDVPILYYELAWPDEGVGSGFRYRSVADVSPRTLGYDEPPNAVTLYDQPHVGRAKARVTGPFTVEAVPAPVVKPLDEFDDVEPDAAGPPPLPADGSVARSSETLRQGDWRDELLKTGIRGKADQHISFARLEPLPGASWLHVEGETHPDAAKDVDETRWPGVTLLKVQMNADLLTEDLKRKRASNESFVSAWRST